MLTGVWVGLIFSVLLVAFGLYRVYQYSKFHHHVFSTHAWPETVGMVVDGYTGYTPGARGGKNFYAVLDYHYLAYGHKYMGTLKKNMLWGQGTAKRFVEKYPAESAIQIHYNPVRPEEHASVLDKTRSHLVVSLVVFLFGFLGIFAAFVAK